MLDAPFLLPVPVHRNLSDKSYEKRKNAAHELEDIVKNLASSEERIKISKLIEMLTKEFVKSHDPHHRMGGVLGLSAVTIALPVEATQYIEQIVPPVIGCLSDQDSFVRYFACEALYNIGKVVRCDLIVFFNEIFEALCKLSVDTNTEVQSGARLLDGLVKDIVTESDQFSIEEFIPLLKGRMSVLNPYVRQFLVKWIIVLNSVPDIDMLNFLPDFLDGLFNMLSGSSVESRQHADLALSEFLQEIKVSPSVDYGRMTGILIQKAASTDEFTRLKAITWISVFIKLAADQLVHYYADILGAILPCISDNEEEIREVARETNEELRSIHVEPSDGIDVGAILSVAKRQLSSKNEATRIEALNWMLTLLKKHRTEVLCFLNDIFDPLLKALSDSSDEVVLLVLEVHAAIAKDPQHLRQLIVFLVNNFRADNSFLERRGALIIRRLCVLLDAERIYREFSTILEGEDNLDFASTMVHALNLVLLTSRELSEVRHLLKNSLEKSEGNDLFVALYASWCHSPVATMSLCLLAQAYQHVSVLIQSLLEGDISVKFLVQVDKLIRLLETPIFTYLRLQLLEPERHIWLMKTLYGLLMLIPQQSEAFKILKGRLKSVPPYSFTVTSNSSNQQEVDFAAWLHQFENVQNRHRSHAKTQVKDSYNNNNSSSSSSSTSLKMKIPDEEQQQLSPFSSDKNRRKGPGQFPLASIKL